MGLVRTLQNVFLVLTLFSTAVHAADKKTEKRIFRTHLLYAPVSFDWNTSQSTTDSPVFENICEGLYRNGLGNSVIRGVAESLVRTNKNQTYTFKIRKSAKWSDGRAVRAQDFIDSWMRALNPSTAASYARYLFEITNAQDYASGKIKDFSAVGVSAVNDQTLVVNLRRPIDNWESYTAFWPLFPIRKDLIEKNPTAWSRPGILVSNGPFTLETVENDRKLILKRNLNYSHAPPIDEVHLEYYERYKDVLSDFKNGKLDFIYQIPVEMNSEIEKRKDLKLYPMDHFYVLGFNGESYPGSNRLFRKAIFQSFDPALAFQKKPIQIQFANSLIWKPHPGWNKPMALPYNVKAARQALKDSGVIVTPKLSIDILVPNIEPAVTIAHSIEEQVQKNLGIKVNVQEKTSKELIRDLGSGNYNLFFNYWVSKVTKPLDIFEFFSSRSSINRVRTSSSSYEKSIDQFWTARTDSALEKAYLGAQKVILQDDAFVKPLLLESSLTIAGPKFKGAYINRMGIVSLKDLR